MVKPLHQNWTGFLPIRDSKSVIIGAQCNECKKYLTKRDSKTLLKHKYVDILK